MTKGIEIIEKEREYQLSKYSIEHDDMHNDGTLAQCASIYACPTDLRNDIFYGFDLSSFRFAKDSNDFDGRIKELAIAGALISAEIERLLRTQETPVTYNECDICVTNNTQPHTQINIGVNTGNIYL